jgi:hypothetical protein
MAHSNPKPKLIRLIRSRRMTLSHGADARIGVRLRMLHSTHSSIQVPTKAPKSFRTLRPESAVAAVTTPASTRPSPHAAQSRFHRPFPVASQALTVVHSGKDSFNSRKSASLNSRLAARAFSSRCAILDVPGIGSIAGECLSSHASAIWLAVAS